MKLQGQAIEQTSFHDRLAKLEKLGAKLVTENSAEGSVGGREQQGVPFAHGLISHQDMALIA